MNKKQFIQSVIIACKPPLEKVEAGIHYAEQVWDKLTDHDYGAAKQSQPRETRDYYKELTVYQREWFDKFWIAFSHPHGKQRAALSWIKLGELTEKEYQQIVTAAKAEALKPRKPGEVRAMAERWLNERRFEDSKVTSQSGAASDYKIKKQEIFSEITSLKRLNEASPSKEFTGRIEELQAQLDELNQ